MRKFVNGICVGAVLVVVGGLALVVLQNPQLLRQEAPQPQVKQDAGIKAAEAKKPAYEWPTDARFAVCSADGKTVAFMTGREIVVVRDGQELFRNTKVNALYPELLLSPDGSRLAAYCVWREKLLILNAENGKEVAAIRDNANGRRFSFSPSGDQLILEAWQRDPERYDTLSDARRIKTEAVCSDDGRTVALIDGTETRFFYKGEPLSKKKNLVNLRLNRNGYRALGYDPTRKAVVLLDVFGNREVATFEATANTEFKFSPGGNTFGLLEPGEDKMALYWSHLGERQVTLPATYTFRIDGEKHVIRYTIAKFYFANVECSTDNELTVEMVTATREGKQEKGHVQWGSTNLGYWYNVHRVYGPLDQSHHFNPDGTLTKYARNE